ncbi:MAG TPA: hypothetical protein VFF52_10205 [Isosphaeraceae bacterium]|nr:hypothetical protein [Isosphaeraceae bacterium]
MDELDHEETQGPPASGLTPSAPSAAMFSGFQIPILNPKTAATFSILILESGIGSPESRIQKTHKRPEQFNRPA